jgi:hypothetical protein
LSVGVTRVLADAFYLENKTIMKETKNNMNEKKTIKGYFKIMADYGGAWGWIQEDGDEVHCNEFIADMINVKTGVWEEIILDKPITDEFNDWQANFESNSLWNPNFDWETFNKKGKELTEKLKQQIGHLFDEVVYETPFEYDQFLKNGVATP